MADQEKAPGGTEKHWAELRLECYRELGYAIFYMEFLNPDWCDDEAGKAQYERVKKLCRLVAIDSRSDDRELWAHWREKIADEIENMC